MEIPDVKLEPIDDDRFGDPVFSARERALLAFPPGRENGAG
jgi:hypothetical protein